MKIQGNVLKSVLACFLLSSGTISYAGIPSPPAKLGFPFPTLHSTPPNQIPVSGSPAASPNGSVIYITSEDGYIYAIDPATGSAPPGWSPSDIRNVKSYGPEFIGSPVVTCDGTIYVASTDQHLYSFNPNGNLNWPALPLGQSVVTCCPISGGLALAANGTVYAGWDDDTNIYAVNSQGILLWTLDLRTAFYPPGGSGNVLLGSAPVVGPDGTIYFYACPASGSMENTLVAVQDQGNSAVVKWIVNLGFFDEENEFQTTMALDNNGRIYVPYKLGSADSSSLQAFNTANGSPVWNLPFSLPGGTVFHTSPALAPDGTIYIGAEDGKLYAIKSNGTAKWPQPFDTQTGQPIRSSPTVAADGNIIFGAANGIWSVHDNGNGTAPQATWFYPLTKEVDSSALILCSDNSVYVGCADGYVYAVYGTAPLAASAWPMYEKGPQHTASLAAQNCLPVASIQAQGYSLFNTTISLGSQQSFPIFIAVSPSSASTVRVHLRFDNINTGCGGSAACYNQDYTLTDYQPSPCAGGQCLHVDDWYGTCQPQPHFYIPVSGNNCDSANYFYINTTAYAGGCVTMTILPDDQIPATYQVDPMANSITFEINQ